jgi:hypothetical protein
MSTPFILINMQAKRLVDRCSRLGHVSLSCSAFAKPDFDATQNKHSSGEWMRVKVFFDDCAWHFQR